MSLLQTERALYDTVWSSVSNYGDFSPGERYLPVFLSLVGEQRGTVLDAGTGSGKGAVALKSEGFTVSACDLTASGRGGAFQDIPFFNVSLWHDLSVVGMVDWVYCTDVLEHLPPQFTMLAVEQMVRIASRGVFISVALVPDSFGVWAGKSLHQTVQSFTWWRDSLRELGTIVDARDLLSNATFLVSPR